MSAKPSLLGFQGEKWLHEENNREQKTEKRKEKTARDASNVASKTTVLVKIGLICQRASVVCLSDSALVRIFYHGSKVK